MNHRLMKYSVAAGLALLLALPAVAFSQLNAPRGPRFAPGSRGPDNIAPMSAMAPQRAQGRLGNERSPRRAAAPQRAVGGRQRGRDNQRGFAGQRGRGNFGRSGRDGAGTGRRGRGGVGGRGGGFSLATRALARADQIGLTAEQRDQITAAQRAVREASITRRAATQIAELELRDLMGAESRDIAAIEVKLRELAEHRIADQTGALRLDTAAGETLTAEQIDELGDLTRNRERSPRGRRAGRGQRDAAR